VSGSAVSVIELRAEGVTLRVVPAWGGRITSLRDTTRSREWLEESVDAPDPTRPYDEGALGGWDEMAPTIAACAHPVLGVALADHGDLWRAPWEVTAASTSSLTTRVRGASLPFTLERTVALDARRVRVDYHLRTEGALALLWAAHPLFRVVPGTRVRAAATALAGASWDEAGVSLEDVVAPGEECKVFLASTDARASLIDPDGATLTLAWEHAAAPYLGVWFDRGAYARHPVVALEPTFGPDDALDNAFATARDDVTVASERRWHLEVSLTDGPPASEGER
jgi:galactose mutarotase-like enzyme